MDVVKLSHQIDMASGAIHRLSADLDKFGQESARTTAEYDKQLAITLVKLQAGEELDLMGNKVQSPPASTSEKIARGICWQDRAKMEVAKNLYINCQHQLRAAMAILSGRQSQNKYLDVDVS